MEPQPLHIEHIALGNIEYHFRAFHVEDHRASFNFRTITIQHGHEPDVHIYSYQDLCFGCPMDDFLDFGPRRQHIIHGVMSAITSFGDSETLNFWKGYVSTYSCEAALMRSVHYDTLESFCGGMKFIIEFQVHVSPGLSHESRVFDGEMVDGVIIATEGEIEPFGARGASNAAINNLERLKFDDGGQFREKDCAICFAEFESEGEDLMRMPCSHSFHYRCLTRWLRRSRSCPLCRYEIDATVDME